MDISDLQIIANQLAGTLPDDFATPIVEAAEARIEDLNQEASTLRAAASQSAADVARTVAAGEMTLAEAVSEHCRRVEATAPISGGVQRPTVDVLKDVAHKAIIGRAKADIRRGIPEALDRAYDQLAKAEAKATKAGDEAAMEELAARRRSLAHLVQTLPEEFRPAAQPAPQPAEPAPVKGGVKWQADPAAGGDLMPTGRA